MHSQPSCHSQYQSCFTTANWSCYKYSWWDGVQTFTAMSKNMFHMLTLSYLYLLNFHLVYSTDFQYVLQFTRKEDQMSQLMRLWYLSPRRPAKAQASLRIHAVLPEPSLFAHVKYGSRRRVQPKNRHLAPLDGCACAFEEWVYGGRKVP